MLFDRTPKGCLLFCCSGCTACTAWFSFFPSPNNPLNESITEEPEALEVLFISAFSLVSHVCLVTTDVIVEEPLWVERARVCVDVLLPQGLCVMFFKKNKKKTTRNIWRLKIQKGAFLQLRSLLRSANSGLAWIV